METLIGACGLVCSKCNAFIATRTGDEALAEATAREWSQMHGVEVRKEHVWCTGCMTASEPKSFHCGNSCAVRQCVVEKKVDNCAACDSYPCTKVAFIAEAVPSTVKIIHALRG